MEEIIKNLWVGGNEDYSRVKNHKGWSWLRCCKEAGPDCHREVVGYDTPGAPQGKEYLAARRGNLMALNCLDVDDPTLIPDEMIDIGLRFLKERYDKGDRVLCACNSGHHRGPTMMLMFLRAIHEMNEGFIAAERKYRTLYPKYDPKTGMRAHARTRWKSLPQFVGKV